MFSKNSFRNITAKTNKLWLIIIKIINWIILHAFLSSADFFCCFYFSKINFFILSGIPSECRTVWIQIRTDIQSVLIWVQTVCKGYQQTTLVGNELTLSDSFRSMYLPISILSVLIWVQTVCKGYRQTTLVGK